MNNRTHPRYHTQQVLRTVIDAIVIVEYALCRRMGYQDIRIVLNIVLVTVLTLCYAVAHKHRYTIELHTFNLNA